jgi:hypothetical protein
MDVSVNYSNDTNCGAATYRWILECLHHKAVHHIIVHS